MAVDEDVGANGAVHYRLKKDAKGHHEAFSVDQMSGDVSLRRPLDREKQHKYNVSIIYYFIIYYLSCHLSLKKNINWLIILFKSLNRFA